MSHGDSSRKPWPRNSHRIASGPRPRPHTPPSTIHAAVRGDAQLPGPDVPPSFSLPLCPSVTLPGRPRRHHLDHSHAPRFPSRSSAVIHTCRPPFLCSPSCRRDRLPSLLLIITLTSHLSSPSLSEQSFVNHQPDQTPETVRIVCRTGYDSSDFTACTDTWPCLRASPPPQPPPSHLAVTRLGSTFVNSRPTRVTPLPLIPLDSS